MAAVTSTVTLHPQDGWVALTSANITNFLRINHFPCHVPIFITVAATAPTGTPQGGFRIDKGSEFFNGPITGNVYARIQNTATDKVLVFVFAN